MLRSTGDLRVDVQVGEAGPDRLEHVVQLLLTGGGPLRDHLLDLGVALRVQHREREVFELPLDVLDAEAVRERCVDVERLLRDAFLLLLRERRDRAHVVEAVGELDDEDADVLRHRDEHLAHRRGLLCFLRVEVDALELRDPVDDARDVGAEVVGEVVERDRGVLDRVVQQRGRDRHVVETEVGEHERDTDGVRDVRVAGAAHLVLVGVARDLVRVLDERGVGLRVPPGSGRRAVDEPGLPHRQSTCSVIPFALCAARSTRTRHGASPPVVVTEITVGTR